MNTHLFLFARCPQSGVCRLHWLAVAKPSWVVLAEASAHEWPVYLAGGGVPPELVWQPEKQARLF